MFPLLFLYCFPPFSLSSIYLASVSLLLLTSSQYFYSCLFSFIILFFYLIFFSYVLCSFPITAFSYMVFGLSCLFTSHFRVILPCYLLLRRYFLVFISVSFTVLCLFARCCIACLVSVRFCFRNNFFPSLLFAEVSSLPFIMLSFSRFLSAFSLYSCLFSSCFSFLSSFLGLLFLLFPFHALLSLPFSCQLLCAITLSPCCLSTFYCSFLLCSGASLFLLPFSTSRSLVSLFSLSVLLTISASLLYFSFSPLLSSQFCFLLFSLFSLYSLFYRCRSTCFRCFLISAFYVFYLLLYFLSSVTPFFASLHSSSLLRFLCFISSLFSTSSYFPLFAFSCCRLFLVRSFFLFSISTYRLFDLFFVHFVLLPVLRLAFSCLPFPSFCLLPLSALSLSDLFRLFLFLFFTSSCCFIVFLPVSVFSSISPSLSYVPSFSSSFVFVLCFISLFPVLLSRLISLFRFLLLSIPLLSYILLPFPYFVFPVSAIFLLLVLSFLPLCFLIYFLCVSLSSLSLLLVALPFLLLTSRYPVRCYLAILFLVLSQAYLSLIIFSSVLLSFSLPTFIYLVLLPVYIFHYFSSTILFSLFLAWCFYSFLYIAS